jgi:hypothetical protein
MSEPIVPLGQLEDQRLEFKSAKEIDALSRSKSDLGRTVVAMLNANGGVVWIGLAERDGRAADVENIANPSRARDAVENHLSSTIDPRLMPDEAIVEPVTFDSKTILRVLVKEGRNKPYAFDRQRSPYYIRVGSRIRGMTREELREAFSVAESSDLAALEAAKEKLRDRTAELKRKPDRLFWIGLIAVYGKEDWKIGFDVEAVKERKLITDARATGSRQGSVLATDRIDLATTQHSLSISNPNWGYLEVERAGRLEQGLPIERLWDRTFRNSGEEATGLLHPIAWIENLAFPLRLAGAILAHSAFRVRGSKRLPLSVEDLAQVEVAVSVAMLHATGVRMRPHSPDKIGYLAAEERVLPTNEGHWHTEEVFSGSDLAANPDRCAFQLTKNFYTEFQFSPLDVRGGDGIPLQFDRVSGRLILPE